MIKLYGDAEAFLGKFDNVFQAVEEAERVANKHKQFKIYHSEKESILEGHSNNHFIQWRLYPHKRAGGPAFRPGKKKGE